MDFKSWWNLPTRVAGEEFALNLLLSADREAACAAAFAAGQMAEREECREVVEECIRTQAHIASNAREALSEVSARIYKRGRA